MLDETKKPLSSQRISCTHMGEVALQAALSMLPLHAEEGMRREALAEDALVQTLVEREIPQNTSAVLVYSLRRQFEALSLLDPVELYKGNWAFVSFPASLLARAWLTTLATPGQSLLGSDYWEQGDACPQHVKEEQRSLLHRVETERVRLNQRPQTIRTVHVAWGLIRWGEKFLLHHREDKARAGEKNYGLPGGRFKLSDLPFDEQSRPDILREIHNPTSQVVARHMSATLIREVEEETGLLPGKHYTFEPLGQPLPPYEEVNGAGNRHAYSVYQFYLFLIGLTPSGETRLLSRIAEDPTSLTWFSAAEIAAPQRGDGAAAYVDALRQAWGENLEAHLSVVPSSVACPPAFTGEPKMLDLPRSVGGPFHLGKPGKEKPVHLSKLMDDTEWQLLLLLGWLARDFRIELKPHSLIRALGNGWVDGGDDLQFINVARELIGKLPSELQGLLEIREDRFISLRISSSFLFFPTNIFQYSILGSNKDGGVLQLARLGISTPWAELRGDLFERVITGNTVASLRQLEKGDDPDGDWERSLRDQLGPGVREIGLRRMWTTRGNQASLADGLLRMSIVPV
jgi:8-oxo-dGTP pyrophosphatase MutT (NUDIX family)